MTTPVPTSAPGRSLLDPIIAGGGRWGCHGGTVRNDLDPDRTEEFFHGSVSLTRADGNGNPDWVWVIAPSHSDPDIPWSAEHGLHRSEVAHGFFTWEDVTTLYVDCDVDIHRVVSQTGEVMVSVITGPQELPCRAAYDLMAQAMESDIAYYDRSSGYSQARLEAVLTSWVSHFGADVEMRYDPDLGPSPGVAGFIADAEAFAAAR